MRGAKRRERGRFWCAGSGLKRLEGGSHAYDSIGACGCGMLGRWSFGRTPILLRSVGAGNSRTSDAAVGQVPPTHSDLPRYLSGLAWSPDGMLYAGAGFGEDNLNQIYTLDPWTGTAEYVCDLDLPLGASVRSLAIFSGQSGLCRSHGVWASLLPPPSRSAYGGAARQRGFEQPLRPGFWRSRRTARCTG